MRSTVLEPRPLVEALERGDLYSSTGVALDVVEAAGDRLRVVAAPEGTDTFKGDEGEVRGLDAASRRWRPGAPVDPGRTEQ